MLYIFLALFILIIIVASIIPKKIVKKEKTSTKLMNENEKSYIRKNFLTEKERDFFNFIQDEINHKNHLLAQVRVVDLIEPNKKYKERSREYMSLFRQVSQWHVDYIIINKTNFNVELAIELDDKTHLKENRIERDRILNKAMMQAGIKLKRVNNKNELKKLICDDKEIQELFKNNHIENVVTKIS